MNIKFYEDHCEKYREVYPLIEAFFENNLRLKALKIFSKVSTAAVYSAYVFLLVFLTVSRDERILKVISVPAAVFIIVTAVRKGINAPRPYEKYPIKPLVHKSTRGKSCPSRHSACAAVIALACLYINIPAGAVMLIIAAAIAFSRPIMGVHFPFDCFFGFAMALILGIIGFYVIP